MTQRTVKTKLAERSEARKSQDAIIQHQVYLQRLADSCANELLHLLDAADRETADYLLARLARIGDISPSLKTTAKFREIEAKIREIRERAFNEIETQLVMQNILLGEHESSFTTKTLQAASMGAIIKEIPHRAIESITKFDAFAGHPIKTWFKALAQQDALNVMSAIRRGVAQEQTSEQIVKVIRGSAAANYQDGIVSATKRSVRTIVRTVTNGMSNEVRQQAYQANADVIDYVVFMATLDSKTSPICRALDGKRWPVGDPAIKWPPLHPNCRSVVVAVAKGFGMLGKRPSKDEDGNAKEVPASMTYSEWFAEQDEAFQQDVLGPTRFKLYQNGELKLDKFVDFNANKQFTLNDLYQKNKRAFEDADVAFATLKSPAAKISNADGTKSSVFTSEDGADFPNTPDFKQLKPFYEIASKSSKNAMKFLANPKRTNGVEFSAAYDRHGVFCSVSRGGPSEVQMHVPNFARLVAHNHVTNEPFSEEDIKNILIEKHPQNFRTYTPAGVYALTMRTKGRIITSGEEYEARKSRVAPHLTLDSNTPEGMSEFWDLFFNGMNSDENKIEALGYVFSYHKRKK